jgi:hypothetical protein
MGRLSLSSRPRRTVQSRLDGATGPKQVLARFPDNRDACLAQKAVTCFVDGARSTVSSSIGFENRSVVISRLEEQEVDPVRLGF